MKALIVISAIALLGQVLLTPVAGSLPSAQPRTLRRRALRAQLQSLKVSDISTQDCAGVTSSCSDCSTVLSCKKIGTALRPVSTTACPAATPYCSAGACTATMPDQCNKAPQPTDDFTCNGEGYFPDPVNCRQYHLCVNGQAYSYDCSPYPNTVYSHAKAMCVPNSEAQCTTTSCSTNTVGTYQLYEQDKSVFFVCTDSAAANAFVGACPEDYKVDDDGNCVLACLREGRLPYEDDNTKYYECIQTATNSFVGPNPATCPAGATFDVGSERCVSSDTGASSSDYNEDMYIPSDSVSEDLYNMPANFKVGSASAAYQVEGAWNEDGKGPSIQDVYFHSRPTMANGDVACDSYHKWEDDIAMLKALKMQMYRFSISWPRVLPTGGSDNPNQAGIDYYNNLIDGLTAAGIEPLITLHHWDIPQVYQDDGGWLNSTIQDRFADYANFTFRTFGDRVKTWIMLNEPHGFCQAGYENGPFSSAAGVTEAGTVAYDCMHNSVLAHAKAYRVYESLYKATQGGKIGSALDFTFGEPLTSSAADTEAADRYMEFQFSWFADPLTYGDYPSVIRQTVDSNSRREGRSTSRLPSFTAEEKTILKGAWDFIGLNQYTTMLISPGTITLDEAVSSPSSNNDVNVTTSLKSTWLQTSRSTFRVNPWGMRGSLNWISKRYNNMPIMVTENGYSGAEDEGTSDQARIGFYSGYMRAAMRAINEDGVNLIGYCAWSLEDNLEWEDGYTMKYGLVYVDFDSANRTRTLKESASFFQEIMTKRRVHYVKAT